MHATRTVIEHQGNGVPTPNIPLPQQTPAEHAAFCKDCVHFYVRKYAEIVCDGASRNSFHLGVRNAEHFLQETFSVHEEDHASVDRGLLDEIRSEVYRQREQVLLNLTLSFSG